MQVNEPTRGEKYSTLIALLLSLFICPTNAQLDCSKRMLKFILIYTLKFRPHKYEDIQ